MFGIPIKSVTLPNLEELINAQFVDDTALFLELSKENFSKALDSLNFFCLASGAKVGPQKSYVLGWSDSPPNWLSEQVYLFQPF